MNVNSIVRQLKAKYPSTKIIKNDDKNPTEIIAEVEPGKKNSECGLAIVVIDKSLPHYHRKLTETYKVIKGQLSVFIDNKEHKLEQGQQLVIKPGQIHWAKGNETWIECKSEPGWTLSDHILVNQ